MPWEETPYFEDPYFDWLSVEEFKTMFAGVSEDQLIGIKRPDYLTREEVPPRIHTLLPAAKLLLVLRNPIDRAVSAYYWYVREGFIPSLPIEDGLEHILNGDYLVNHPKSQEIIDYGFYYQGIQRYLAYYDREQLFVSLPEDFKTDALQTIRAVYDFLGVDRTETPKSLTKKPKKTIYSLTRLEWLKLRNPYIHEYHYYGNNMVTLDPKRGIFPTTVKAVFHVIDRALLAPVFGESKPKLSEDLQVRLIELYQDDILGIEDFLGRDLTTWTLVKPET